MMEQTARTYLPAAGHHWSLPLYDPLVKLLGGDAARRRLLDQAAILPGHRVLDIGCGTGTLITLVKRLHPDADVVGLDPDPAALDRAKHKARRAGITVQLDRGFADELPYTEQSFDRVLSSFMFHHLETDKKEQTLREVRRVLKPGGSLYLLDFGGPESGAGGLLARFLHSRHRLKDNDNGRILALMENAGFAAPRISGHGALLFARTTYYQAAVPA